MCQMIARIDADPEAGMYRTNNFGLDYMRFLAHCPMDTPLELLKLAFQCVVVSYLFTMRLRLVLKMIGGVICHISF